MVGNFPSIGRRFRWWSGKKDKCLLLPQCLLAQHVNSSLDAMEHSHAGVAGCCQSSKRLGGADRVVKWLKEA